MNTTNWIIFVLALMGFTHWIFVILDEILYEPFTRILRIISGSIHIVLGILFLIMLFTDSMYLNSLFADGIEKTFHWIVIYIDFSVAVTVGLIMWAVSPIVAWFLFLKDATR